MRGTYPLDVRGALPRAGQPENSEIRLTLELNALTYSYSSRP
jgi:hypothetical protein